MKIIVGLGNPEAKYNKTRHNIGFAAIDRIAEELEFPPFKESRQFQSLISENNIYDEKAILVKPLTYMNLSGNAVQAISSYYKIEPSVDLFIIYDDVDLPFGEIRIRQKGSAGTHNGMKSIVSQIGPEFHRIRLGIRNQETFHPSMNLSDYVLSSFTKEEQQKVDEILAGLPTLITDVK